MTLDKTPHADSVRDYPPLPDFDRSDAPIWEAIFNWQTTTPGPDAYRKANAIESAIINQLRAYVDADRAARAPADSVTAPAGGVVAAGRFMDEAAERRSAQEGYENRIRRVSERNPHDEGMYSLGWWDRAWKAAAPTSPAQPADSVLEDAARWLAIESMIEDVSGGDGVMVITMTRNAKPEPFLKRFLALKLDALDAARKQGASHD